MRGLPLRRRRRTATACFTANRAPPRPSSALTATARSKTRRRSSPGNGGLWNGTGHECDLRAGNTPSGPRFFWQGNKLFQRSMMSPDLIWEVPQTIDTIDPNRRITTRSPPTQKRCVATAQLGATCRSRKIARATSRTTIKHLLRDLPHVVGDFVFRLPFADEGEPARAAQQI
jgi:hypothetical protein